MLADTAAIVCARVRGGLAAKLFLVILTLIFAPAQRSAQAQPFAYVTLAGADSVLTINTATRQFEPFLIPVGPAPHHIAIGSRGDFAYVANSEGTSLSVIDLVNNVVSATVDLAGPPAGIAIAPDGSVYVAGPASQSVFVIQADTHMVRSTISVGGEPQDVAVAPDGAAVYVAGCEKSGNSFTVCVIDATTGDVASPVPVGNTQPTAIAATPDGSKVYVANCETGSCVMETASNTVVASIAGVGRGAVSVAFTPDGAFAYIPNPDLDSVSVIDTQTDSEVDVVDGIASPACVGLGPDGTFAYVTSPSFDRITVIDTVNNEIAAVTSALSGVAPYCVAVAPFLCAGDCDGNANISADELLRGVYLVFDPASLADCPTLDRNDDDRIAADEIVAAVRNAVRGCS